VIRDERWPGLILGSGHGFQPTRQFFETSIDDIHDAGAFGSCCQAPRVDLASKLLEPALEFAEHCLTVLCRLALAVEFVAIERRSQSKVAPAQARTLGFCWRCQDAAIGTTGSR
jgi:hypothetical protein